MIIPTKVGAWHSVPFAGSRFALIAGEASTPTDKAHRLGTPHARGPSEKQKVQSQLPI